MWAWSLKTPQEVRPALLVGQTIPTKTVGTKKPHDFRVRIPLESFSRLANRIAESGGFCQKNICFIFYKEMFF